MLAFIGFLVLVIGLGLVQWWFSRDLDKYDDTINGMKNKK